MWCLSLLLAHRSHINRYSAACSWHVCGLPVEPLAVLPLPDTQHSHLQPPQKQDSLTVGLCMSTLQPPKGAACQAPSFPQDRRHRPVCLPAALCRGALQMLDACLIAASPGTSLCLLAGLCWSMCRCREACPYSADRLGADPSGDPSVLRLPAELCGRTLQKLRGSWQSPWSSWRRWRTPCWRWKWTMLSTCRACFRYICRAGVSGQAGGRAGGHGPGRDHSCSRSQQACAPVSRPCADPEAG